MWFKLFSIFRGGGGGGGGGCGRVFEYVFYLLVSSKFGLYDI
jgi:hypothetical protein